MANNPTLLKMPLAADGEKATIPETTGSTTGEFSQQYGFQAINALPLQAGGIAPKREDFNGVFNLLGGVAYYAQKGWTFHYDAAQDYYIGCLVIDPADGNRYECIADMPAGTVAPHADSDNDYWRRYTLGDYDSQLLNKADTDLGNLNDSGKRFFYPSSTFINVPITNTTYMEYTVPANGYIAAQMDELPSGYGYIIIASDSGLVSNAITYTTDAFTVWVPLTKGEKATVSTVGGKTINNIKFYYAQGEVQA